MANITNRRANSMVSGTSHADKIYNSAHYVTISADASNDDINNSGAGCSINAGDDDTIENYGYGNRESYVTINAGKGNDYIDGVNKKTMFLYANGDGNDRIVGFDDTDTLSIAAGSYTSMTSGNDVIVTVGNGKITLVGAKGKTLNIKGTYSNSTTSGGSVGSSTTNSLSNRTFTGTSKADAFYNYGSNVKMNGATGNDYLVSFDDGSKVTLTGGTGNDTLKSWSAYSSIDGGDGADHLYAGANHSTILGGAGNDSITNSGSNVTVLGGYGNDTIRNYADGKNSSLNGGDGNDSIKAGNATKVTIVGGTGNDTLWGSSRRRYLYLRVGRRQ